MKREALEPSDLEERGEKGGEVTCVDRQKAGLGDSSQISDWTLKQGPAMERQLRLMDLWPGAPWIQNQKLTCKSKCTKIK